VKCAHVSMALVMSMLLVACGGEGFADPSGSEETDEAVSAASIDDNTVVSREGDGVFQMTYGMDVEETQSGPAKFYYVEWGYWIDLRVQNLAYDKAVGVVWTDDNWNTAHWSYAQYETDLGGGYERWGVDLSGRDYSAGAPTVQYAAFAEMNGNTYWGKEDNWKNYVIRP